MKLRSRSHHRRSQSQSHNHRLTAQTSPPPAKQVGQLSPIPASPNGDHVNVLAPAPTTETALSPLTPLSSSSPKNQHSATSLQSNLASPSVAPARGRTKLHSSPESIPATISIHEVADAMLSSRSLSVQPSPSKNQWNAEYRKIKRDAQNLLETKAMIMQGIKGSSVFDIDNAVIWYWPGSYFELDGNWAIPVTTVNLQDTIRDDKGEHPICFCGYVMKLQLIDKSQKESLNGTFAYICRMNGGCGYWSRS
ncbi:MAG: hypothetical protein NXY57DRAFT_1025704 [Lentinula lateritia]|nr:MAG: hypothetical protein NXY57DRAFT_1025704 [Lentinula lateritia]